MQTKQVIVHALAGSVLMCLFLAMPFMLSSSGEIRRFKQDIRYCPPRRRLGSQAVDVQRSVTMCKAGNGRLVMARARYAFVSIISVTAEVSDIKVQRYINGAIKLGSSILDTWQSPEPVDLILLVALDKGLTDSIVLDREEELHAAGWQICPVDSLDSLRHHDSQSNFHKAKLYSKLHVWRMKEYEAVAMLDADMLALQDMSGLFLSVLPEMRAAGLSLAAADDRPNQEDSDRAPWYTKALGYCGPVPGGFNAGVLLLLPSRETYNELRHGIDGMEYNGVWCEQGLLNVYFKNRTFPLPERYNTNLVLRYCSPDRYSLGRVALLHYTVAKPWWTLAVDGKLGVACWEFESQEECKVWNMQCVMRPGPK